jgi:hypothetical protein
MEYFNKIEYFVGPSGNSYRLVYISLVYFAVSELLNT